MMQDTAMKFVGQGSGQSATSEETSNILTHLQKFLRPSHQLMNELKERFITQVIDQAGKRPKMTETLSKN
jgi:hypothetical protein